MAKVGAAVGSDVMRLIICLLLLTGSGELAVASVQVVDDLGLRVELESSPERIVSLSPHLTELLFSLGVGEKIVATVEHSDYPPAAQEIPRLGDAFSLSVEAIIDLSPDLILAWSTGGNQRTLAHLRELGYVIYLSEARSLEAIGRAAAQLGALVGKAETGLQLEADYLKQLLVIRTSAKSEPEPSIFFQISDEQLYTVNGDHLIGQAITACGGRNIFGELDLVVPMVSLESVLDANPDLILVASPYEGFVTRWSETWHRLGWQGRIRYVNASLVTRPGLRMLEGIKSMCKSMKDV